MRTHWSRIVLLAFCAVSCGRPAPITVSPERQRAEEAAAAAVQAERSLGAVTLSPNTVGIAPFDVTTTDSTLVALGYGLADLLITDLARSRRITVVDRIRLDAVLREIDLARSGAVDSSTAPRVGRLIQAGRLVLGHLADDSRGELGITARLVDVATGTSRTAVTARASVDAILAAEKQLAFRLFEHLDITLSPAERSDIEQLPTRNIAALLAYSRGVRYETLGQYELAAGQYQQAVKLDPGFHSAQASLESVQAVPGPSAAAQASAGTARAAAVVSDRLGGVFVSPTGSQLITSPTEGGGGSLVVPTRITISVEVPE
jgi:TolB-like protein